jgi:hypothetical protein
MIKRLKSALRRFFMKLLGIDEILIDLTQIKDMTIEHDKALAVSAFVQIKIMNELLQNRERTAKKSIKKKDYDEDLVN